MSRRSAFNKLLFTIVSTFVVSLLSYHKLYGQPPVEKMYDLVKDDDNVIRNESHLDDFFEKLYQLKSVNDRTINIIHIGDSHIQADLLTDVVRKSLQQSFGNAGRGLIVPGRVAGTNEPLNIRTSSSTTWNAKRCIYVDQPLPIGIGGITISTDKPGANLTVKMNDPLCDYSFNTISIFYEKNKSSFNFSLLDTTMHEVAAVNPIADELIENYSRVSLPAHYNQIAIQTTKPSDGQNHATIFGLNFENGKEGILYHSIGVNGAKYSHYNAARHFARQTSFLHPDLFIISLGTNESVDYPYLDKNFYQHITKLVESLSAYNPDAKFILVTPPDSFKRKVKLNPGVELIREQIIQYAVENGFAFWDMYKVNGGKNSAALWRMQGLLRADGVHFSKEGYRYQGTLLYEAIMKSYNNYVPNRP